MTCAHPARPAIGLVEYELLADYPEVHAFSTTRHGGCSTGSYASLNCTPYVGDDPQHVLRNQELLMDALPVRPESLVIPWQTHGTQTLTVGPAYLSATPEERFQILQGIDALTTDVPGLCLCISTADCIPILLYDPVHHAVAAVHAGWRGTAGCIVLHTLECMQSAYGTQASDIVACLGPGISQEAYEVGEEVFHQIYDALRQAGVSPFSLYPLAVHNPVTGKYHIDLPRANRVLLRLSGLSDAQIADCGICTYTRHEDFFSARRMGTKSGRILSGIMIQR